MSFEILPKLQWNVYYTYFQTVNGKMPVYGQRLDFRETMTKKIVWSAVKMTSLLEKGL